MFSSSLPCVYLLYFPSPHHYAVTTMLYWKHCVFSIDVALQSFVFCHFDGWGQKALVITCMYFSDQILKLRYLNFQQYLI